MLAGGFIPSTDTDAAHRLKTNIEEEKRVCWGSEDGDIVLLQLLYFSLWSSFHCLLDSTKSGSTLQGADEVSIWLANIQRIKAVRQNQGNSAKYWVMRGRYVLDGNLFGFHS